MLLRPIDSLSVVSESLEDFDQKQKKIVFRLNDTSCLKRKTLSAVRQTHGGDWLAWFAQTPEALMSSASDMLDSKKLVFKIQDKEICDLLDDIVKELK